MIGFGLRAPTDRPLRVLLLGAHCDDIEIGCGGAILRLLADHPDAECRWVVFSGTSERIAEAHRGASGFLGDKANMRFTAETYRDGFFPQQTEMIKEQFESMKSDFTPDVIFTHRVEDAHQDHRLIAELTWQTFRNHMILEYEIPKYEGDLGRPNIFVPFDRAICDQKASLISEAFPSQQDKHWFTTETLVGLARLRGIECRSRGGYAEGFMCRKVILF